MKRCCGMLLAVLVLGFASVSRAEDAEPLTAFVVVDDASIAAFGPAPLDRALYGRAIERAAEFGARGVVVKFFFATPGDPRSDAAVARAMATVPVLMQVFPGELKTGLPATLVRKDWNLDGIASPLVLTGVALPAAGFATRVRALGFVDARITDVHRKIEVAARVGDDTVGSLLVAALELATGTAATVASRELRIAGTRLPLDDSGRVTCDTSGVKPKVHSMERLLDGSIAREAIRGKVVVLGYDRADSPTVDAAGTKVKIHTMFYRQLACVARQLRP